MRSGSQSALWGLTGGVLWYSKCRDWGCFGGMREQNTRYQFMHICLLAMLSFSRPFGLTAVFMDGLNCSVKAPQYVQKALWITRPSSDSATNACFGVFTFLSSNSWNLEKKTNSWGRRYFAFLIDVFSIPFNPLSSCELNGEPVSLSVMSLCHCRHFYYQIYILKLQNLSLMETFTLQDSLAAGSGFIFSVLVSHIKIQQQAVFWWTKE